MFSVSIKDSCKKVWHTLLFLRQKDKENIGGISANSNSLSCSLPGLVSHRGFPVSVIFPSIWSSSPLFWSLYSQAIKILTKAAFLTLFGVLCGVVFSYCCKWSLSIPWHMLGTIQISPCLLDYALLYGIQNTLKFFVTCSVILFCRSSCLNSVWLFTEKGTSQHK